MKKYQIKPGMFCRDDSGRVYLFLNPHQGVDIMSGEYLFQIVKWLQTKCTDSAAYKMWGNGVALPCVDFVMCSLANRIDEEETKGEE